MFYPVYYLLMLMGIVLCAHILENTNHSRYIGVVTVVFLLLQLFDLKTVIWEETCGYD